MTKQAKRKTAPVTCEGCGRTNIYCLLRNLQCKDSCNTYYNNKIRKVGETSFQTKCSTIYVHENIS